MGQVLQLKPKTRQEKNVLVHNVRVRKDKIELAQRILATENQLLIHKSAEDLLRSESSRERDRLWKSGEAVEEQRKYWDKFLNRKIKRDGRLDVEKLYVANNLLYIQTIARANWYGQQYNASIHFTFVFRTEEDLNYQIATLCGMLLLAGSRVKKDSKP